MREYEIQFTLDGEVYNVWCNAESEEEVLTRTTEICDENGAYRQTVTIGDHNPIITEMEA